MEHSEHAHPEHNEAGSSHVVPWRVYGIVYLILLFLMVLTIVFAKVDLGPLNNPIAMAIAVTKASLVVLFFMQVRYGSKLVWVWAALGFIWLIFLFGTFGDYLTRDWLHVRPF